MRRVLQRFISYIMPVLIANQNESITTMPSLGVEQTFNTPKIFQKGTPVWSKSDTGANLFVMPKGDETDLRLNGVLADDVRYEGAAMKKKKIENVAVVTGGVVSVHTEIVGIADRAYKDLDTQWQKYAIIGDKQLNEYRIALKTGIRKVAIETKAKGTRDAQKSFVSFVDEWARNTFAALDYTAPSNVPKMAKAAVVKLLVKEIDTKSKVMGGSSIDTKDDARNGITKFIQLFSRGKHAKLYKLFNDPQAKLMDIFNEGDKTSAESKDTFEFKKTDALFATAADLMFTVEITNAGKRTGLQAAVDAAESASPGSKTLLLEYFEEIKTWKYVPTAATSGYAILSGGFAEEKDDGMSFAQPPSSNPSVKKRRAIKESLVNGKSARSAKGGSKAKALGPFIDPLAMEE